MSRPPLRLLAVGTLLVAALLAADATAPERPRSTPAAASRKAQIVGSLTVCPELQQARGAVQSRLTVGTPVPGDVSVNAAPLQPGGDEGPVVLDEGGQVGTFGQPGNSAVAVAATATGDQAGGVTVEQVSRGVEGLQRGLASVRCEPAIADSWFVGAATTISDQSDLILANPYDDAAIVDVDLFSADGELNVPGTDGVVVPPRTRVVRALAKWAPDVKWLAVRVVAESGRVASAVRRSRVVGQTPAGVDWVPRTGRPTDTLTVGALPAGPGERVLLLFNPGEDPALARVQINRPDGQTEPAALGQVEVPAGRLVAVPVTKELNKQVAVMQVSSDGGVPLLAGAYAEVQAAKSLFREIAFTTATPALTGPALLTDNRVGKAVTTTLVFTAPEGAAEVTISPVGLRGDARPTGAARVVPVPQGELVIVSVADLTSRGDPRPVLLTPSANSGPVYVTRIVEETTARGPLVTALGVHSQPIAGVTVPAVRDDPAGWLLDR